MPFVLYNGPMSTPILATKLYAPPPLRKIVRRPRLIEQLNHGIHHKLILISAPAGFGKTTLISEWVNQKDEDGGMKDDESNFSPSKVTWLSLDERDNDPTRFLTYVIAALQEVVPTIGEEVLAALQSPQLPPIESILTMLINEITPPSADSVRDVSNNFILVLDDYHLINAQSVDQSLAFLLEHAPPQMHLIITTREDPPLPLARYRARGQLTELRAADLRFTSVEAADFLNKVMGLNLSPAEIDTLETRTEGWIAGLQLAALSIRGQTDTTGFIQAFSGSHRFVLDYLVEEVLQQQPENVQAFLLHTSILDSMCGSLCDAVVKGIENRDWRLKEDDQTHKNLQLPISNLQSQKILSYLEQTNLFIIPLDNERRWYRYHHLLADLLRQRLQQRDSEQIIKLHIRASQWYEENDMELEAFHHATAANDIERAERLVAGKGMPLPYRGALIPVLNWLASLETAVLDARPSLWVLYGSVLTMSGQPISYAEEKLQAAEAALQNVEPDDTTRDLIGQIAANRAMLAIPNSDIETIVAQSQRALEYLHPDNLPARTNATWTLGLAHQFQRNHAAAIPAFTEAIAISQAFGNNMVTLAAATCLGQVQEAENQLNLAAQSYQLCLQTAGDPPWPSACEAALGYARVHYQWNDLDAAEKLGQLGLRLSQQMESVDTPAACWMFLARLKLAQGDVAEAATLLAKAEQYMRQRDFLFRLPDLVAVQVLMLLHRGDLTAAANLAEGHVLPLSQARVFLAQGETASALAVLEPLREQMEAKNWPDELLKVMVLQAVVYDVGGDGETAVKILTEALTMAEPDGFIRIFIDEGLPMAALLTRMKDEAGRMKGYVHTLLTTFGDQRKIHFSSLIPQPLAEPLSKRELEILSLIAAGLKNKEIAEQLMISLNTVLYHIKNIYSKLGVNKRTLAITKAKELNLIE